MRRKRRRLTIETIKEVLETWEHAEKIHATVPSMKSLRQTTWVEIVALTSATEVKSDRSFSIVEHHLLLTEFKKWRIQRKGVGK